jgi:hypothetical protein
MGTAWFEYRRAWAGCESAAALVPDMQDLGPAMSCPACASLPQPSDAPAPATQPTGQGTYSMCHAASVYAQIQQGCLGLQAAPALHCCGFWRHYSCVNVWQMCLVMWLDSAG